MSAPAVLFCGCRRRSMRLYGLRSGFVGAFCLGDAGRFNRFDPCRIGGVPVEDARFGDARTGGVENLCSRGSLHFKSDTQGRDVRWYAASPRTDGQTLSRCSTAAVSTRTCRVSAASSISDLP